MRDETVEKRAAALAEPFIRDAGLVLWDVAYLKEGADFVLRFVIDKKGSPVGTDDCEHLSRKLSDALDEDDFIPDAYLLEVSSPGLERELSRPEHFKQYIGQKITIQLKKKMGGEKKFVATLLSFEDGALTAKRENGEIHRILLSDTVFVKVYFAF